MIFGHGGNGKGPDAVLVRGFFFPGGLLAALRAEIGHFGGKRFAHAKVAVVVVRILKEPDHPAPGQCRDQLLASFAAVFVIFPGGNLKAKLLRAGHRQKARVGHLCGRAGQIGAVWVFVFCRVAAAVQLFDEHTVGGSKNAIPVVLRTGIKILRQGVSVEVLDGLAQCAVRKQIVFGDIFIEKIAVKEPAECPKIHFERTRSAAVLRLHQRFHPRIGGVRRTGNAKGGGHRRGQLAGKIRVDRFGVLHPERAGRPQVIVHHIRVKFLLIPFVRPSRAIMGDHLAFVRGHRFGRILPDRGLTIDIIPVGVRIFGLRRLNEISAKKRFGRRTEGAVVKFDTSQPVAQTFYHILAHDILVFGQLRARHAVKEGHRQLCDRRGISHTAHAVGRGVFVGLASLRARGCVIKSEIEIAGINAQRPVARSVHILRHRVDIVLRDKADGVESVTQGVPQFVEKDHFGQIVVLLARVRHGRFVLRQESLIAVILKFGIHHAHHFELLALGGKGRVVRAKMLADDRVFAAFLHGKGSGRHRFVLCVVFKPGQVQLTVNKFRNDNLIIGRRHPSDQSQSCVLKIPRRERGIAVKTTLISVPAERGGLFQIVLEGKLTAV